MNQIQASRFKDAPWFPKKETHVIVGGVGGIGSWLSLLLARAGFIPIVFDFDIIEEHNIGGQFYDKTTLDIPKVEALEKSIKNFTDTDILVNNTKYTKDSMSHHYVFSAFDNMEARKDMFHAWKGYVKDWKELQEISISSGNPPEDIDIPIFIDGRLLMEQLTIFCVTPDNIEEYEKYLFPDSDVAEAPCTLKQTSHSAAMIASHMVGFFTNHITNNVTKEKDRNIPFKWEYFIPLNFTQD